MNLFKTLLLIATLNVVGAHAFAMTPGSAPKVLSQGRHFKDPISQEVLDPMMWNRCNGELVKVIAHEILNLYAFFHAFELAGNKCQGGGTPDLANSRRWCLSSRHGFTDPLCSAAAELVQPAACRKAEKIARKKMPWSNLERIASYRDLHHIFGKDEAQIFFAMLKNEQKCDMDAIKEIILEWPSKRSAFLALSRAMPLLLAVEQENLTDGIPEIAEHYLTEVGHILKLYLESISPVNDEKIVNRYYTLFQKVAPDELKDAFDEVNTARVKSHQDELRCFLPDAISALILSLISPGQELIDFLDNHSCALRENSEQKQHCY